MLSQRNPPGRLCGMDDRYCIDNGAMIAWTGLLQYLAKKKENPNYNGEIIQKTDCTQRFRTDAVLATWRDD